MNRYDFMKSSDQCDTDGETWPDPLSIRYNNIKLTTMPRSLNSGKGASAADIAKFWYTMYKYYGTSDLDDVLLSVNGIKYIGDMHLGDSLAMLDYNDLSAFNNAEE